MSSKTLNKYVHGIKIQDTSKSNSYETIDDEISLPNNITHHTYSTFSNRFHRFDIKYKKYDNLDEETKRYLKENYLLPVNYLALNVNLHYSLFKNNIFYNTIKNNLKKMADFLLENLIVDVNNTVNKLFLYYNNAYMTTNNILNFLRKIFYIFNSIGKFSVFKSKISDKYLYFNYFKNIFNSINILLTYIFNRLLKNTFISSIDVIQQYNNSKNIEFFILKNKINVNKNLQYINHMEKVSFNNLYDKTFKELDYTILFDFNTNIFSRYKVLLQLLDIDENQIQTISDLFKFIINNALEALDVKKTIKSSLRSIPRIGGR
jgi:hypothetical protein